MLQEVLGKLVRTEGFVLQEHANDHLSDDLMV